MEWDKTKTLQFIELYKKEVVLWDAHDRDYFNKFKKHDAWERLSQEMGTSIDICRKKLGSLLASLRREKTKVTSSMGTGRGSDEIYHSTWFAYKPLLFVLDRKKPRQTLDTVNSPEHEEENFNKEQPPRKKIKNKRDSSDDMFIQAFDILRKSSEANDNLSALGECETFGMFVGKKIKNYSPQTRSHVQYLISNILHSADRGEYECLEGAISPVSRGTTYITMESIPSTSGTPSPQASVQSQGIEGVLTEFADLL